MKIFVMLRTRNEERNIARFCQRYPPENVEKILISDGYSTDKTIEIAKTFPNTFFRPFMQRVNGDNGIWRQPECKHLNFLLQWAREEGADEDTWILQDDCDSVPTEAMVRDFRKIFEQVESEGKIAIDAYHLYLWGDKEYFPQMNHFGRNLWAWKMKANVKWDEQEDWGIIQQNPPLRNMRYDLSNPYALLHFFCVTEEIAQQKYEFYKKSNRMANIVPILKMGGPRKVLEDWMK